MDRFYIFSFGFFICLFFGSNAVWTAVDGKARPGTSFIEDTGIVAALTSIPSPFQVNLQKYMLADLPDVDGWQHHVIDNPWTVRPIGLDGMIPSDADMAVLIAHTSDPFDFEAVLVAQEERNRRARAGAQKRTGAHYANSDAAFNVVLVRWRDLPDPEPSTPVELYISTMLEAITIGKTVLDTGSADHTIAGIPFKDRPAARIGTQMSIDDGDLYLEGMLDGHSVYIWGVGDLDDVKDLVTALSPVLDVYVAEAP